MRAEALRLYPPPCEAVVAEEIYAGIALPQGISINMISTLDGLAAIEGRVGGISNPLDRRLMRNLRGSADAVITSSATLRAEPVSLSSAEGSPQPTPVIISARGSLPPDTPVLKPSHPAPVILLGPRAQRHRIAGFTSFKIKEEAPDFKEISKLLYTELGAKRLLLEGGPTLNHSALQSGLTKELFLTLSPKLAAGESPLTIVQGPTLDPPQNATLLGAFLHEQTLYLRYSIA